MISSTNSKNNKIVVLLHAMPLYQSLCVYWKWPRSLHKLQLVLVLFSCIVVQLCLGSLPSSIGNIVPYLVSYIRILSHPRNLRITHGMYLYVSIFGAISITAAIGGLLVDKLGPRAATIIGGACVVIGTVSSYFTINISFYALLLTCGVLYGIGGGLAFTAPIKCAMSWLPKWKGLASAIGTSGFGVSPLFFNLFEMGFINPHNKPPNDVPYAANFPNERYFNQHDILERLQEFFLVLAACLTLLLALSSLFLVYPHPSYFKGNHSMEDSSQESPIKLKKGKYNGHLRWLMLHSNEQQNDVFHWKDTFNITNRASQGNLSISLALSDKLNNIGPKELICRASFYILWIKSFLSYAIAAYGLSLYKSFGLEVVTTNDYHLTVSGCIASVFNMLGRFGFGLLEDITDNNLALVFHGCMISCLLLTFCAVSMTSELMYIIWTCGMFFCIGGYSSLYPSAVAKRYGLKRMSVNYGLLHTSCVFGELFASFAVTPIIDGYGWQGAFLFFGFLSCVDFILAMFLYRLQ